MLSGSNDSNSSDKGSDFSSSRGNTRNPLNSPKLAHYVANSVKAPEGRAFKQEELKQGHQFYQRSLFGGLLGVAFFALLGGIASAYFGYTLLGVAFLCIAGGASAVNYWINQSIPEFKATEPCAKTPENCTQEKEKCPDTSPKVIFRGVSYSIKHQSPETPEPTQATESSVKKIAKR